MTGKPCFAGTRILVYLILQKLAAGENSNEIPTAYPQLKAEHIMAALEYAAQLAADELSLQSNETLSHTEHSAAEECLNCASRLVSLNR
jgi:uncharacterized protein (DUF433 family)